MIRKVTSHVSLVMWCFITSITRSDFTRRGPWVFKPRPAQGLALLGILTVVFVLCARALYLTDNRDVMQMLKGNSHLRLSCLADLQYSMLSGGSDFILEQPLPQQHERLIPGSIFHPRIIENLGTRLSNFHANLSSKE